MSYCTKYNNMAYEDMPTTPFLLNWENAVYKCKWCPFGHMWTHMWRSSGICFGPTILYFVYEWYRKCCPCQQYQTIRGWYRNIFTWQKFIKFNKSDTWISAETTKLFFFYATDWYWMQRNHILAYTSDQPHPWWYRRNRSRKHKNTEI